MRNFIILSVLLLISTNLYSQKIEWLNPVPQGNSLNAVKFINETTGFAVGTFGTIVKTNDSGNSWTYLESGFSDNLTALFFTGQNTGYIVGENGLILKTSDGGNTWQESDSKTSENLTSVFFPSSLVGYVAGDNGTILKTEDAGTTWTLQNFGYSFNSLYFTDINTGYSASNSQQILKTTDGGKTWIPKKVTNQAYDYFQLYAIYFTDANNGITCGQNGKVYKTTDGGETWTAKWSGSGGNLKSICFVTKDVGFMVGDHICKTTDGGNTWTIYKDFYVGGGKSIVFSNNQEGFITSGALLLKTSNCGDTWAKTGNPLPISSFRYVHSPTPNSAFALGSGLVGTTWKTFIYKTLNYGKTWETIETNILSDPSKIYFQNENVGFISSGSKFYKTNDGGLHWIETNLISTNQVQSIFFTNAQTGYLSTDYYSTKPAFFKTTDGGTSWIMTDFSASYTSLGNIYFNKAGNGFMMAKKNDNKLVFLTTTDNGDTWNEISVLPVNDYFVPSFSFSDDNTLFVSCQEVILKSSDAGKTWVINNTGNNNNWYLPIIFNDNKCYSYGRSLLQSSDDGVTWTKLYTGTDVGINGMYCINKDTCFAFGINGPFMFKLTGMTTGNRLTVPDQILKLEAKEPNSINFEINANVNWTIKSYDSWIKLGTSSGNGNGTISVSADVNTIPEERKAVLRVSAEGMKSRTIVINQDKAPSFIRATSDSVNLQYSAGDTAEVEILSNCDWEVSVDKDWLIVNPRSGKGNAKIKISVTENTLKTQRVAILKFKNPSKEVKENPSIIITQQPNYLTKTNDSEYQRVSIYPNPVKTSINIKGDLQNTKIIINDISGKQVLKQTITDQQIDLSKLSKGIYILQITNNNGIYVFKFVKE